MKRVAVLLTVAALTILSVAYAAPSVAAATHNVGVSSSGFHNGGCSGVGTQTSIGAGDTVVWINCDGGAYNVTWDNNEFPTQNLPTNGTVQQKFTQPGFYGYTSTAGDDTGIGGTIQVIGVTATTAPPATTSTTVKPTTTTSSTSTSTSTSTTETTDNLNGVFDTTSSSSTSSTTSTTNPDDAASKGESGSNLLVKAVLFLLIAGVAGGAYFVYRRMRAEQ
jgi:plastocyanin